MNAIPKNGDVMPVPAPDGFFCFTVEDPATKEQRHGVVRVRNFIGVVVWTGATPEAAVQALRRAVGYFLMVERLKAYRDSPQCTPADEVEALKIVALDIDDVSFAEKIAAFLRARGVLPPSELSLVDQLEQDGRLAGMVPVGRPQ